MIITTGVRKYVFDSMTIVEATGSLDLLFGTQGSSWIESEEEAMREPS